MDTKIIKGIKDKIKEVEKLRDFDARHPRFRAWHVSTIGLLKLLPAEFKGKLAEFKKLSFEDTKYRRGKNLYDPAQNQKYLEDLSAAASLLSSLIPKKSKQDKQ
ncbi:MAG: hypothetical protein PHN32_06870 [Actinomycetota bacterium]|jgi:hypothetical protein|nr:hypothetical protein [Actinomycetota bacterium]